MSSTSKDMAANGVVMGHMGSLRVVGHEARGWLMKYSILGTIHPPDEMEGWAALCCFHVLGREIVISQNWLKG